MINMRYLIVSLASVFLALGIGMFIGLNFDGQEIFLDQQETLVNDMEYKFEEIRTANEELQQNITLKNQEIDNYGEFANIIFPKLINSKLQNMNIAIIETNDDYSYTEIPLTIQKADGEVSSTIYIKKEFLLEESEKTDEIYKYFTQEKGEIIDKDNFSTFLSEKVAQSILEQDLQTLEYLQDQEVIELEGEYGENIDCFIIAGGSDSEDEISIVDTIDVPFIKMIKQHNIPIIGVEKSDVKNSYIETYKKQKISTIDNIDSIIGQYSLVEVILGNSGNYGVKSSADFITPQPK